MSNRLVVLYKLLVIRLIGCGKVRRLGSAKCILLVIGYEAKTQCGKYQLCFGLEAGINGGIYAMRQLWHEYEDEDEWGFLLVDTRNVFNEINRTVALWTVRHLWPSGVRLILVATSATPLLCPPSSTPLRHNPNKTYLLSPVSMEGMVI